MPKQSKAKQPTKVLNFRISLDLHRDLERYGKTLTDDAGQPLSAGEAARRIVSLHIAGLQSAPTK